MPPKTKLQKPSSKTTLIERNTSKSSTHTQQETMDHKVEDNKKTSILDRKKILKKRKLRSVIINTISITICLVGIYFLIHLFWRNYQYETTNDAMVDQYITPLTIRVSGYLQSVRFTEHQWVKKNDTLIQLDNIEYRLKVEDAQAALLDAQASLEVLQESIQTSKTNVNVMDANIEESKAKLEILKTDYHRYKNLSQEGTVPQQQFDKANAEYESMKAHSLALQKQRDMAISQTHEMTKRIANAQAHILRKKADLEMAKLNLSYTIITAPFDGYIGRRNLEAGQFVQAGQVLTNLVNDNEKWVIANYKETQVANIYIGQPVRIKIDAFPNQIFQGKITTISAATGSKYSLIPTDNSAGNFVKVQQRIPVRIDFENMNEEYMSKLRAGMMVETEAIIKK